MSSPIDICNMALAHLGDRRITRLDDDAQTSDALVRYCAEFYAQARQEALAAHQWTFAHHIAALSRRTDTTVIGFTYSHQLSTDRLRVMRLFSGGVAAGVTTYNSTPVDSFKIVGSQVWSNSEFIALEYIRDVNNPDDWSPHFRAAVARLLAAYLAGPTADNPDEVTKQMRIYETVTLPNAQYYDAVQDKSGENSQHSVRLAGSPLLQARLNTRYGQSDPTDFSY
jgi:hypothetical protein